MWRIPLLLFCGLGQLWKGSDSERLHVQVTIPQKIQSVTTGDYESHATYNITIGGNAYTVNLIQKAFLPNNFRVYSYDDAGIMKPLEEPFENFCFYQGYIEGYPNSVVIVSTCTGLRGLLQFGNVSYGIEPLGSSIGFEHVVYQIEHKKASVSLYAEKDIELRDLPYKIQSVETQPELFHFIEMHIVVEKQLYDHMGTDTAIVTQKIFQLIGLANAIFTSFNVTVILSSLEFWIDENKIETTGDANKLLHRFLKWKRSYLVLRPHDIAFLLVYRETSDYVGATFQGKMCDKNYAGGVALHPKAISLESLAVILVQLLSLSMGIAYDDVNKCQCPGSICVMNPEAIHSSGVKVFSTCSVEDFGKFISSLKSQCLQNQPNLQLSYQNSSCGNGVVDPGEDCDCGSITGCDINCCDSNLCTMRAGAACYFGPCCRQCQFASNGEECRRASGECDVPEYCNGTSALCQDDFFVIDGHPCGGNKWLCMHGMCQSGVNQCLETFGIDTDFGPPECFQQMNSKGDISGSCGIGENGYKVCAPDSVACGKVICKYEDNNILRIRSAIIVYANISGQICITIDYPRDHDKSEKMWVREGTVCGQQKVCRNNKCVDQSYLDYNCTPATCNNHGVCNNQRNCHCDATYLPPDCTSSLDMWPGGSINSGNWRSEEITGKPYIASAYHTRPTRWPFFLIIPFYIVLCVLIAILVKVRFQRRKWAAEEYSSDDQFESESESKD